MDVRSKMAVTGMGVMTGLGLDLESTWEGLANARNPIRRFSLFKTDGIESAYGVELPEGAEELFAREIITRARMQMTRNTMIAVHTAKMALDMSGLLLESKNHARVGVVVGATGSGYVQPDTMDSQRILRKMASSPAAWISLRWKLGGPSFVVSTACSSGTYAINVAHMLIASGQCDAVVTGSVSSTINYLDVEGFGSLMALAVSDGDPTKASRPFDKKRNGFVMGEGGGLLVLESPAAAKARGAKIYAYSSLPGITSEAYNILSPKQDGVGMAESMTMALGNAGLSTGDIDYINAHGTSTPVNDLYETMAIKRVFGERAKSIPVSSTKSMTGHCLAGAAGVEAVICVKALMEGVIPPTINLTEPDDGLDLDFVPGAARRANLRHVMSNSFAFGGHNGTNVFSHPDCV